MHKKPPADVHRGEWKLPLTAAAPGTRVGGILLLDFTGYRYLNPPEDVMKVIVLGAAVLDITASAIDKNAKWEEKQRIERIMFSVGGDAANQSIRLCDMGVDAAVLSAVGADQNAELIKNALSKRNVDTSLLIQKNEYPTGTSLVLLDKNAERTIFSVQGGAYAALNKDDVRNLTLNDISAISIASLFIEPQLESDGGMLELLIKANQRGIPTFADLSHDKNHLGLDGIREFLPHIDYFLPSLYDAEKMNGVSGAENNARIYRSLGCKNVIIKCGSRGVYAASDNYEGWIAAPDVEPVDTTGAGDCMVALFVSRILNGDDIARACSFACMGASLSTLYYGASEEKITGDDIALFGSK